MHNPLDLTPLQIASGRVYELDDRPPTRAPRHGDPRAAIESAVRTALERPPCLVAFSGGRDSSIVLAVAAAVARHDGLDPPIPVTLRFPACETSDELQWQERVVGHLSCADWLRLSFADELDSLGPIARRGLARHGLLWPANIHSLVPPLEAAAGGALLTGHGGDEILHPGRHARLARILAGEAVPAPRDLGRLAFAAAPRAVRARRRRREASRLSEPWLRPDAVAELADAYARLAAGEPVRRARWSAWAQRLRSVQLPVSSLAALASDTGTTVVHPFLDDGFVASYGRATARRPVPSRTAAIAGLFGDLLPGDVVERRTKATFDGAFWGDHSTAFASRLTPDEVDSEYVDGRRAIEFWLAGGTADSGPVPSATLLQALWLESAPPSEGERVEERVAGGVERPPVPTAPEL